MDELVAAAVGVPEITPVAVARVNPAGNAPLVMLQRYGVVPPVATRVALNVVPAVPLGNAVVVMPKGDGGLESVTGALELPPAQPARIKAIAAENRLFRKEVHDLSTNPNPNKVRRHPNHGAQLYSNLIARRADAPDLGVVCAAALKRCDFRNNP